MSSTKTQSIGEAIHNSVRLISQAGTEIEALFAIITSQINSTIENELSDLRVKISRDWSYDWAYDDSEWVCNYSACSLGLKSSRNRLTNRYLVIEAVLDGDGMTHDEANNKEPLLHVSLWDVDVSKSDNSYTNLDYTNWDFEEDQIPSLQHDVLINWFPDAADWTGQAWTYSLFLTSINNLDDIKQKIIEPIVELLRTNDAQAAKLTEIEGVIHYEQIGDKYKYRVINKPSACSEVKDDLPRNGIIS